MPICELFLFPGSQIQAHGAVVQCFFIFELFNVLTVISTEYQLTLNSFDITFTA
jgi:hypothetical protein